MNHERGTRGSNPDRAIAGGDFPLVDDRAVLDDVGAAVQGTGRANVCGQGEDGGARGKVAGVGRLDDQVLLALAAQLRLGDVEEGQPGSGRVSGHRLVAQVKAETAGTGM